MYQYIGQPERDIKERIKEHKSFVPVLLNILLTIPSFLIFKSSNNHMVYLKVTFRIFWELYTITKPFKNKILD